MTFRKQNHDVNSGIAHYLLYYLFRRFHFALYPWTIYAYLINDGKINYYSDYLHRIFTVNYCILDTNDKKFSNFNFANTKLKILLY